MSSYPIAKAKEQLSRLIDEALRGETVTITRHGKPVVELRPSECFERMSRAEIESLRRRRAGRPPLGENADTLIRRIRDMEE